MPPREHCHETQPRKRRSSAAVTRRASGAVSDMENALSEDLDELPVENSGGSRDGRLKKRDFVVNRALPFLVFVDMFAVSLVVPLLFQYYRQAGVTNANQRELLSSVFSTSQIVGGLIFGAMTDAKLLRRKTILYLSFGGSALSYFLIAYGNFSLLLFSRVLVGLVKQTMTVSTSMITKYTDEDDRAVGIGKLQSAATAAWIAGPTMGAFLFKWDSKAPALVACVLFATIAFASVVLLPEDMENDTAPAHDRNSQNDESSNRQKATKKGGTFWQNLKRCFSSKKLGCVIASLLLFSWITRSTSYSSMGSYYEDMYGLQPHHRGYIQSYQSVLKFVVQSVLIGPVLQYFGGERMASCVATLVLGLATLAETQQSLWVFVVVLCPLISVSVTTLTVSLRALLTSVAPEDSIFSVFAALDVLENAAAVTVPFYRTQLFALLPGRNEKVSELGMKGDPDPVAWAYTGATHWLVAAGAISVLLLAVNDRNGGRRRSNGRKHQYTQNKTV